MIVLAFKVFLIVLRASGLGSCRPTPRMDLEASGRACHYTDADVCV